MDFSRWRSGSHRDHYNHFRCVYPSCFIQWICKLHRGLFTSPYLDYFKTFSQIWYFPQILEVSNCSKLKTQSISLSNKREIAYNIWLSVWPDATFACVCYTLTILSISPLLDQKHSEKLEHVSWWIIAHGPKYCRRFLTNQKELRANIYYASFLCKRVSGKTIRSFIEPQSSTRLDHPKIAKPKNHKVFYF